MKKEIKNEELKQVNGGFVPEYETDTAGIGGGRSNRLSDDDPNQLKDGGAIYIDIPS